MELTSGVRIQVRTAFGEVVPMVALGTPEAGRDFAVVWVCPPEDYEHATALGEKPEGLPWPLDAVVVPQSA